MDHFTPEEKDHEERNSNGNETPEKIATDNQEKDNVLTPKKEVNKLEQSELKSNSKDEFIAKKLEENKTPEKSRPTIKDQEKIPEKKTPEKLSPGNKKIDENKTPEKGSQNKVISKKLDENKTPQKTNKNEFVARRIDENKTPQKVYEVNDFEELEKSDLQCDGEEGMISATEQARLFIAASKTPTKILNKTPNKSNTPTGKRSVDGSPITPGKFRRVELITLSSPKAKRFKQI